MHGGLDLTVSLTPKFPSTVNGSLHRMPHAGQVGHEFGEYVQLLRKVHDAVIALAAFEFSSE
jgi:hypothetical protein